MHSIPILLLLACSTESQVEPTPSVNTPAPSSAPPKLNVAEEDPRTTALTPSPLETRLAAERAGLTTSLPSLIPDRNFNFRNEDVNHIAMRTGILLADTVLTISELPKEQLLQNLKNIEEGLSKMKAGKGLLSMLSDIRVQVTNDSLTRKELLSEMEDIVSMSVPEQGFGKEDKTGPLLQAGAWLSSINLVSKAIVEEKNPSAASKLLRHGKVADYFLLYAETKGRDKAPEAIIKKLQNALQALKSISEKETIILDDVQTIISETDALLSMI